ncbi:MAG: methylated-DNA--[protein]-cysteine S-methyltransferase [Alphaproteobacteria bacterium]|nr:methylated-DNA--[protein]-cysteine S-methyltransferase [Alphaproteobacteria bacterium]
MGALATNAEPEDYGRIGAAIEFLTAHFDEQPSLGEVAGHVHLSPYHFQRLFTHWAGISPKRFVQYLTLEHAKRALDASASILDAAYEAGLSGPGRLHDLFVTYEAMTPGDYKRGGAGRVIRYGIVPSPFGACFIGTTEIGICALGFIASDDPGEAEAFFHARWPAARLTFDRSAIAPLAAAIFALDVQGRVPLRVHLIGTAFQLKVWEALLRIPPGALVSYQHLAAALTNPDAARAVGGAVGANPVSYLIPCHRVIRKAGVITGYAWGPERKRALLALEGARHEAVTELSETA